MNKEELRIRLNNEKIPVDRYSLEGGLPYDKICLSKSNDIWEVYYSERGEKFKLKVFDNEESACDYFYSWLIEELRFDGLI